MCVTICVVGKAAKASSSRPPQAAQAAQAAPTEAEVLFAELHAVDGLVSKDPKGRK